MPVDIAGLVELRLAPAIVYDSGLTTAIPTEIAAQIALQGWEESSITDQEKVYIALLTIEGLLVRLLLKYSDKLESAKGGPAETKWQQRIDFLKELSKEVKSQIKRAQHEAAPEDELDKPAYVPRVGWTAP